MRCARTALDILRDGNRRHVFGLRKRDTRLSHLQRANMTGKQEPFAIILGCSDPRVAPEIIFDRRSGELFVVRVAGNVVGPTQIDSIQLATRSFGTRLVVVLGHSHCAAVVAALEELQRSMDDQHCYSNSIVARVRIAIEGLLRTEQQHNFDELLSRAVRANISASVRQLRQFSKVHSQLTEDEDLIVVGAEYSVETGVVDFFDDVTACRNVAAS